MKSLKERKAEWEEKTSEEKTTQLLMAHTINDFDALQDMLNFNQVFKTENEEELDRLTVELLKVVELKKIASILAEKE